MRWHRSGVAGMCRQWPSIRRSRCETAAEHPSSGRRRRCRGCLGLQRRTFTTAITRCAVTRCALALEIQHKRVQHTRAPQRLAQHHALHRWPFVHRPPDRMEVPTTNARATPAETADCRSRRPGNASGAPEAPGARSPRPACVRAVGACVVCGLGGHTAHRLEELRVVLCAVGVEGPRLSP